MDPRKWTLDVPQLADQLVNDYRNAADESAGDLDAIGTVDSWRGVAQSSGEVFSEDDWLALGLELAGRVAGA